MDFQAVRLRIHGLPSSRKRPRTHPALFRDTVGRGLPSNLPALHGPTEQPSLDARGNLAGADPAAFAAVSSVVESNAAL